MAGTKQSVVKGAAWIGLGRIVLAMLGFVSTVILARLLMPEDFGLVAIASAAAMMVATVTELPLSQAIIHHDDPDDDHLHTIWTFGLLKGLAMFALIAIAAKPLAIAYGDPRLTNLLLVLAVSAALGSIQNPSLALFEREMVFWQNVILDLLDKVCGLVVSVAIAYLFQSYWALVLGVLTSAVVRVTMSYLLRPYRPRVTLSKARELLSFSIWLTFGSWVQALNWRADPLVIGSFVTPALLGFYTVGNRVTSMAVGQVLGPIASVLFPALSRMKHDLPKLRRAYLRVQAITCAIAFPMAAGLIVLAEPIVLLVLGEKWLPAVPLIQGIAAAEALRTMHHSGPLALATGHTKALFRRDLQVLMVRVPLLFGGILIGQATDVGVLLGAVLGRLLATLVMTVWNMYLVKQIAQLAVRRQFINTFRPFFASVAMVTVLYWVTAVIGEVSLDFMGYVTLATLIALGGVVYIVSLLCAWWLQGRPAGPESEALTGMRQGLTYLRRTAAPD